MKRYSEFNFNDLIESKFGSFIKVYWNGLIIYDDDLFNQSGFPKGYLKTHSGKEGIEYIKNHYSQKKIYSIYIQIISFHHTILFIEGEN